MKRLIKWLATLVVLLIVAVVAAVLILTTYIDPNQFKPLIISEFRQFTGFEMSIPGRLSWTFYPNIGMEATEVTISDPAVFSSKLKNLVLRVNWLPLLHRQVDFSKVNIETVQLNHLQISHVRAKLSYQDKVLRIQSLSAEVYQGDLNAEATVFLNQVQPVLHVNGILNQVDMAELVKGLSGANPKLQLDGHAKLSWNLTTQGKRTDELIKQLNGHGALTIGKGSIKGVDFNYFLNTAAALIDKQPLPPRSPKSQTEFEQIKGTALIKNGIMRSDDLSLDSLLYTARANGSVDLTNKTLDYHVNLSSKVEQKTSKLLALYGKTVPVRVTGSLSDPSVTLDTLALMQEIGKEQLQKVGQEIQKMLPDRANKMIQNIFH